MSRKNDELYEAAVALPLADRVKLVMRLLDSMGDAAEVTAAQSTESTSRLMAIRSGELVTVDDDEALRILSG